MSNQFYVHFLNQGSKSPQTNIVFCLQQKLDLIKLIYFTAVFVPLDLPHLFSDAAAVAPPDSSDLLAPTPAKLKEILKLPKNKTKIE
jgi:hypothetical protein